MFLEDSKTSPNYQRATNSEFEELIPVEEPEMVIENVEDSKKIIAPVFENEPINNLELSSNNKFFTPINEPQEIQINETKKDEFNPMDMVNNIDPLTNSPKEEVSDLKSAINAIRGTIRELGNKGNYINVEEIDLADTYQITININKD